MFLNAKFLSYCVILICIILNIFVESIMANKVYGWKKNYCGITVVHDPSVNNLLAIKIMFFGCNVTYPITLP